MPNLPFICHCNSQSMSMPHAQALRYQCQMLKCQLPIAPCSVSGVMSNPIDMIFCFCFFVCYTLRCAPCCYLGVRLRIVELEGFLFFGSTNQLLGLFTDTVTKNKTSVRFAEQASPHHCVWTLGILHLSIWALAIGHLSIWQLCI